MANSTADQARWAAMAEQARLDAEKKKAEAAQVAEAERLAAAARQAAVQPATPAQKADVMAMAQKQAREQSAALAAQAEDAALAEDWQKNALQLGKITGESTAMPETPGQSERARLADAARFAGAAASSNAPGMGAAPGTSTPAGMAADVARLEGAAKASAEKPKTDAEIDKTASSAADLVTASPSKVSEVLDKLKEEEAKGGPDFWDVIQAAAAGWGGQVPLYVQKEIAAKEAEREQEKTETLMQREAAIREKERGEEQEFQRGLAREEMANRLKLAGIYGTGGVGGLSLADFLGGK